ncbi:hypothetical protein DNTS_027998, partial [Danionella cerebrum]
MFRLRVLTASTIAMVQLSRRYHTGTFQSYQRRRLMLAALAGMTGFSASAGFLWTSAYAETGSSVKHDGQLLEEDLLSNVTEEVEAESALESSGGEEEDEAGLEGKKKKPRVGFRDR